MFRVRSFVAIKYNDQYKDINVEAVFLMIAINIFDGKWMLLMAKLDCLLGQLGRKYLLFDALSIECIPNGLMLGLHVKIKYYIFTNPHFLSADEGGFDAFKCSAYRACHYHFRLPQIPKSDFVNCEMHNVQREVCSDNFIKYQPFGERKLIRMFVAQIHKWRKTYTFYQLPGDDVKSMKWKDRW